MTDAPWAQRPPRALDRTLKYSAAQEPLLRRLGAAVVLHWDTLPDDLQDLLIDQAVAVDDADAVPVASSDIENFVRKVRSVAYKPPPSAK